MKILTAHDYAGALNAATDNRRLSSYNYLIADRLGNMVDIEGSATDYALIAPYKETIFHTNNYIIDKMKKYENHPHLSETRERYGIMKLMIDKIQDDGELTVGFIKNILSDHSSQFCPICQHGNAQSGNVTLASTIINLTELKMEVCAGNPCSGKYSTYRLT